MKVKARSYSSTKAQSPHDGDKAPSQQRTDTVVPTSPVEAPAPVSTKSLVQFSLLLLLIIDALLLAANVAHIAGADGAGRILRIFSPISWNGDYDGSHLEVWGHIKLFAASAVLVALAFSYRSLLLAAWGTVLLIIMGDDLFQVHEQVGEIFIMKLGLEGGFGLRPQDFGELLAWAILGAVALLILMVGHIKTTPWERRQSWFFVGVLALFAVFAVGVDMLHIIVHDSLSYLALHAVTLAETAGEIIPMSIFLALAIKLAVAPHTKSKPLSP